MDEYDNMEVSEESDDDIDMKELVGAAGGNAEDEDNDYMINDEIQDIDSDDDEIAAMAYQNQLNQERMKLQSSKVPGLSLGGIGGKPGGLNLGGGFGQ